MISALRKEQRDMTPKLQNLGITRHVFSNRSTLDQHKQKAKAKTRAIDVRMH
jgi:hypothetical protein